MQVAPLSGWMAAVNPDCSWDTEAGLALRLRPQGFHPARLAGPGGLGCGGCGLWTNPLLPWELQHLIGISYAPVTCARSFKSVFTRMRCSVSSVLCQDDGYLIC